MARPSYLVGSAATLIQMTGKSWFMATPHTGYLCGQVSKGYRTMRATQTMWLVWLFLMSRATVSTTTFRRSEERRNVVVQSYYYIPIFGM